MTTINPAAAGTTTNTRTGSAASSQLANNFETFLTLLTAQLQNQDPLSPMDTKDFTQQLVQYSGVEQQLKTNDLLESLTTLTQASAGATAVAYLGKTATASTNLARFEQGSNAKWDYQLDGNAATNNIRVVDSNNRTVFSTTGELKAGQYSFNWDGRTNSGRPAASGTYSLVIEPRSADNRTVGTKISQTGVISGVDMSGATPLVRLNGADVPLTSISTIRQSSSN